MATLGVSGEEGGDVIVVVLVFLEVLCLVLAV